jgi:glycine cleavage system H protein
MSTIPASLSYTKDHEWARQEPDGTVAVGITHFAQDSLGDIVYLDLPAVGKVVAAGATFGVVESTKSVSDLYAPLSGKVVTVNTRAVDEPGLLNTDPYGAGWLVRIQPADPAELGGLLSAEAYAALTGVKS